LLKNHPHPEPSKAAHHGVGHHAGGDYRSVSDITHQWSDGTFTGSSRCSAYSWGLDEAVSATVAASRHSWLARFSARHFFSHLPTLVT